MWLQPRSEDGQYNMKLFVLLLENHCEMPDKAEAEMQDKRQAGLKFYVVCLLGLVQRFFLVRQVPAVESSGNSDEG